MTDVVDQLAEEFRPSEPMAVRRAGPSFQIARVLSTLGKTLIAAGLIVLLFAGYQLWGTGVHERLAQGRLEDRFAEALAAAESLDTSPAPTVTEPAAADPAPTTTTTMPPELVSLLYPADGEPVAVIRIPSIGVEKVVVEGVGTEDLKKGPGRFPDTPLPGMPGNAAIAGHRTTYGAPFYDIDRLQPGDEIRVTTVQGDAVYAVAGTQIVAPEQVEVVGDFGDNRLTLTACHPKYSAAQRIVVWASLVSEPFSVVPRPGTGTDVAAGVATTTTLAPTTTVPEPATTAPPAEAGVDDAELAAAPGLEGDSDAWPAAIAWSVATALVAAAAWVAGRAWEDRAGRSRLRRLAAYSAASPVFLVCLYFCFANVDRLLPAY